MPSDPIPQPVQWLLRIPEIFADFSADVLNRLDVRLLKKLGREYFLVSAPHSEFLRQSAALLFVQWNLPVHHAWPCHPQKMEGFIEKAAQALFKKFGAVSPQTILTGPLNAAMPQDYYKGLGSNFRGRLLQLFPMLLAEDADSQQADLPTLFCMVGREGLFCGVQTPRDSNGFHPGGTRFVSQAGQDSISRAGAKIAEALHYLRLHRPPPAEGSHWLDLGASPGGMTAELLNRGYTVTAVDRAPLDTRLSGRKKLSFICADVNQFRPPAGAGYDAILCDMNGDPRESFRQVRRIAEWLKLGGLIVFTLKLPAAETVEATLALRDSIVEGAASAGINMVAQTHLTYNRHEFTLFLAKAQTES